MFVLGKSTRLRQGDVLEKVFFTPASFHELKDGQMQLLQVSAIRQAHLVVVSQCCELEWFQDDRGSLRPRRAYVLVAPLSLKLPVSPDLSDIVPASSFRSCLRAVPVPFLRQACRGRLRAN